MLQNNWTKKEEDNWKKSKERFFDKKLEKSLKRYKNPLVTGDNLGRLLRDSEKEAVDLTTPRAVKKWASKETGVFVCNEDVLEYGKIKIL